MLDPRAILLMNALGKWGVLPPDKMVCEIHEKQFEKWYHGSFTLSKDPFFQKKDQ